MLRKLYLTLFGSVCGEQLDLVYGCFGDAQTRRDDNFVRTPALNTGEETHELRPRKTDSTLIFASEKCSSLISERSLGIAYLVRSFGSCLCEETLVG